MNSASPAPPSGQPAHHANGTPVVKRKKVNDPLFRPKPKPTYKKIQAHTNPPSDGQLGLANQPTHTLSPRSQRSLSPVKETQTSEERYSAFSDPRSSGNSFKDYKVVTTKRDLLQGMRFHVMQFSLDKPVDIRNEADFTRPVRLHRRDPRAQPPGPVKEENEDMKDGLIKAEREELNARKEARQKEREANLAQVAPSGERGRRLDNFKKKTAQVWRNDYTTEERRRIQNSYEEKLPWHLEDFDNKHGFIGSHLVGSSYTNAAFIFEPANDGTEGRFRLVPVEKAYSFRPKPKIQAMTIEEAEAAMKKTGVKPEWLKAQERSRHQAAAIECEGQRVKGLYGGVQSIRVSGGVNEEGDLDFDDDFADDEDGELLAEKDEDARAAEKRIVLEQRQANFLDFKEELDVDEAEEKEKREEEAKKILGKKIKKALERREKNYDHGSDSEAAWTESTDSEEERLRLEDKQAKEKAEADAKKSGVSSPGTNTPSGKKENQGSTGSDWDGGMKKSSSSNLLKRPASPNLSDASGTDRSARKKTKNRHLSSTQPLPQPSRPQSPANVPPSSSAPLVNGLRVGDAPKAAKKRKSMAPGAGSDNEAAAHSDGGAMSDGSKAKRLKINGPGVRSPTVLTPQGSSSRAVSQRPVDRQARDDTVLPTPEEILAVIPPEGITSKAFFSNFPQVKDKKLLVSIVRRVAKLDGETKLLLPKDTVQEAPGAAASFGSSSTKQQEA